MSFQTDFGNALRAARKRAGWSQTELATRSGVHLNTVSQVERGSADPRLSTLQALGATLGLNLRVDQLSIPFNARTVEQGATDVTAFDEGIPAFLRRQAD
jgi:transcriptional regulator with XRE-family HTH domain